MLAFVAAYHGGWVDAVVRILVDVLITIPALLVLVVIASAIHTSMSTTIMAMTIALLAWREPATADPRAGAGDARGAVCEAGGAQRRRRRCASSFAR